MSALHRLFEIVTSKATQEEIAARVKGNPKTSWLAGVFTVGAVASGWLLANGFFIGGGLVAGATSLIAIAGLLFAGDKP